MEPSLGKLKLGDGLTMLGSDFFLEDGVCLPSEQKLQLYDAWTTRIADIAREGPSIITKKEMESFNGSLNFGAFAIADAKVHLQFFFKLAAAKWPPSLRRKGLCMLNDSATSHAEALRDLFRATSGLAFFDDARERSLRLTLHEGITDANHVFTGYCGMGGVIVSLGIWWFFRFEDQAVLQKLKIHVLEMLADVVNVALAAAIAPKTRYRGWIDNQSAMFGIRAQNASDLKLFEILLARHAICRKGAIKPEPSEFVPTKENTTDPISRGDFEEFLERAEKELGTRDLLRLDIAHSPLASDLTAMITHLCNLNELTQR
jgi:hypothetical protein